MGIVSWAKRQPSRAAAFGRKVVAADQIKDNAAYIADMARSLGPDEESRARRETFENAYARLNMTPERLARTYGMYSNRFLLFLFFLVIAVVLGVGFAITRPWSVVPVVGFVALCLAQMFTCSFRMAQIRHRELFSVVVWLKNPHEWWIHSMSPPEPPRSKAAPAMHLERAHRVRPGAPPVDPMPPARTDGTNVRPISPDDRARARSRRS